MKIIILGAGQVGGTLAEHLADEQNEIVVVDTDTETLRSLQDRLDIGTVTGEASHPNTLYKAVADILAFVYKIKKKEKALSSGFTERESNI